MELIKEILFAMGCYGFGVFLGGVINDTHAVVLGLIVMAGASLVRLGMYLAQGATQ